MTVLALSKDSQLFSLDLQSKMRVAYSKSLSSRKRIVVKLLGDDLRYITWFENTKSRSLTWDQILSKRAKETQVHS